MPAPPRCRRCVGWRRDAAWCPCERLRSVPAACVPCLLQSIWPTVQAPIQLQLPLLPVKTPGCLANQSLLSAPPFPLPQVSQPLTEPEPQPRPRQPRRQGRPCTVRGQESQQAGPGKVPQGPSGAPCQHPNLYDLQSSAAAFSPGRILETLIASGLATLATHSICFSVSFLLVAL